jgi:UDP-arabinose 4-epimerase
MTNPGKYFRNNTVGTLNLLEAMREAGVGTIVFSSTCATDGNPVRVPIDEAHPQAPVNPYGESKLMVEKLLQWYGRIHGLRWMALRYFNVAGADPDGEIGEDHDPETHLMPLVIGAVQGRRPPVQIYGTDYATADGTAVRDYIHVTDLAEAHLRALEQLGADTASQSINLGTGLGHSVREVVETVARVGGRAVPAVESPRRPGDPPELVAAPARARDTPRVDVPVRRHRDDSAPRLDVAREARLTFTAAGRPPAASRAPQCSRPARGCRSTGPRA